MTTFAQWACAESYLEVESTIDQVVNKFAAKYGDNYDDLRSEANEAFLKAYRSYNHRYGTFRAWVGQHVWFWLIEWKRRSCRRKLKRKYVADMDLLAYNAPPSFDAEDFCADLPDDCRAVVDLLLESPLELTLAVSERGEPTRPNIRAALIEVFTDLGWTAARTIETFSELGKALS